MSDDRKRVEELVERELDSLMAAEPVTDDDPLEDSIEIDLDENEELRHLRRNSRGERE